DNRMREQQPARSATSPKRKRGKPQPSLALRAGSESFLLTRSSGKMAVIPTHNPKVRPAGRRWLLMFLVSLTALLLTGGPAWASETSLAIPNLDHGSYPKLGGISPWWLLFWGACIIAGTLSISLYQLYQIKKQPAHRSMLNVANTIF